MVNKLNLMLFTNDIELAKDAQESGVDRIVIDLERRGKKKRQLGYHLECNYDTINDIENMRKHVDLPILCRINPINKNSKAEIKDVINAGADYIMLPMIKDVSDIDYFLESAGDKVKTILLLENKRNIKDVQKISEYKFDELYVGLNDLALSYGFKFCYEFISNGILDKMRGIFKNKAFGFGGITIMDGGCPLPTKMIITELARLKCSMVILRRAFKRDIIGKNMKQEILRIKEYYGEWSIKGENYIMQRHRLVCRKILNIARSYN